MEHYHNLRIILAYSMLRLHDLSTVYVRITIQIGSYYFATFFLLQTVMSPSLSTV